MTKQRLEKLLVDSGHYSYVSGSGRTRWAKDGRYTLNYGEYERPDYSIRKEKNQETYKIYAKFHYFSGVFGARKDGVLSDHDMNNLEYCASETREA